jgi:hypothetical protein
LRLRPVRISQNIHQPGQAGNNVFVRQPVQMGLKRKPRIGIIFLVINMGLPVLDVQVAL